jgi:hypothetical protein
MNAIDMACIAGFFILTNLQITVCVVIILNRIDELENGKNQVSEQSTQKDQP